MKLLYEGSCPRAIDPLASRDYRTESVAYLVAHLAYCVDRELWKAIDYLKEQVRVLKEQQEEDKRILLNDHQRIRLAAKAKRLTRRLLEETTVLFTPDTILGWYRRLLAQKYDGRENCKNPGRPRISKEITDLVIRFKQENPHRGYTRIRDYLECLGHKIGETTVKNILVEVLRAECDLRISKGQSEHCSTQISLCTSPLPCHFGQGSHR